MTANSIVLALSSDVRPGIKKVTSLSGSCGSSSSNPVSPPIAAVSLNLGGVSVTYANDWERSIGTVVSCV